MPVSICAVVTQYDHEPILIAEFYNDLSIETMQSMHLQRAQIGSQLDAPIIWRILVIQNASITFPDVLQVARILNPSISGCLGAPRFHFLFGGFHPMAKLLSDLVAKVQFGALHVPVFAGLGEAFFYIQDEMDKHTVTEPPLRY